MVKENKSTDSMEIRAFYNWKQTTPADEFIIIKQAIEGNLDNVADGTVTNIEMVVKRIDYYLLALTELAPFLKKGAW